MSTETKKEPTKEPVRRRRRTAAEMFETPKVSTNVSLDGEYVVIRIPKKALSRTLLADLI